MFGLGPQGPKLGQAGHQAKTIGSTLVGWVDLAARK